MKKTKEKIDVVIEKLKEIENYLKKLTGLIPEESLKEYENSEEIKKAAVKTKEFSNSRGGGTEPLY